ncbi:acetyltransferase [Halomonas aquamarina]|uniref:Acetyltransferase n=2 Tax=Vreelandella aquamarina TaxID=77097 RepID=A0ACC5VWB7_9GAMM|nr:acetyltransferase [Halomonas aquamarina]
MHPAWFIEVKPPSKAAIKADNIEIETARQADYPALIALWEDSVRATHDFLAEEDLLMLKPLIFEQFITTLTLQVARAPGGEIKGFSGVGGDKLEMLFIDPSARGQGIGTALVEHAIDVQGVRKVDVNEQNELALGFYRHLGFEVRDRSPVDGLGKPYPLLHMALSSIDGPESRLS